MTDEEKARAYDALFADMPDNTINDFSESTMAMLNDTLDLFETKVLDQLKDGNVYGKNRIGEILCFAHRYVIGFAKGQSNQKEK